MYNGSGTVDRIASGRRAGAACAVCTHLMAALFCVKWRHEQNILSWNCDVKSKIRLRQLMRTYSKNNPAKFHPYLIWNDGVSSFLKSVAPTRRRTRRWVAMCSWFNKKDTKLGQTFGVSSSKYGGPKHWRNFGQICDSIANIVTRKPDNHQSEMALQLRSLPYLIWLTSVDKRRIIGLTAVSTNPKLTFSDVHNMSGVDPENAQRQYE